MRERERENRNLLLTDNEIFLKKLNPEKNITIKYLSWLNDKKITQYTEQKYKKHSIKDIKKFVIEKNNSKNEFLFGIFLKKKNIHIGNIKLGPIKWVHKSAEISYFIGEKKLHRRGYASNAIKKILTFAKKIKIKKINAGFYKINKGSERVLKKNGFKIEGILKSQIIHKKKRIDSIIMGKIL
jgi:RimJ/RimL family protein N-acetyltransferase